MVTPVPSVLLLRGLSIPHCGRGVKISFPLSKASLPLEFQNSSQYC